ncbi:hypothetical protein HZB03_05195 [Candidatus Woesearchaeota archaeon]|nr:hypothetical protein [Candidatus Woesearchaeota archaeon]
MKLAILIVIIVSVAFIALGCKKIVYVCANGIETEDKNECPYNKLSSVKQKDAEKYATNYVGAFVNAKGGKSTLVSSYTAKGDFYVSFVVSPKDQPAFETTVRVDGITAQVNCTQSCQYTQ